jgi:hypothetical protein
MHGQIALNGVALTGQPVAQIARSISTVAQDAEGQIVTLDGQHRGVAFRQCAVSIGFVLHY